MWLNLISLAGTVGAYVAARAIAGRVNHALTNSFVVGTLLIIIGLAITGLPYEAYRAGAEPIAFLLGPATVALGVPLSKNLPLLKRNLRPVLVAGVSGALAGAVSVTALALLAGTGRTLLLALIPKSVTTPVAVAITELLGGEASLAAAMTTATGFTGVLFARPLLTWMGIDTPLARGLALGVSLHAMGTGAALEESQSSAAAASLGMAIAAVATALAAPVIIRLLG